MSRCRSQGFAPQVKQLDCKIRVDFHQIKTVFAKKRKFRFIMVRRRVAQKGNWRLLFAIFSLTVARFQSRGRSQSFAPIPHNKQRVYSGYGGRNIQHGRDFIKVYYV